MRQRLAIPYWELTDSELAEFFCKLHDERKTMSLSLDQLRNAEVIVAERIDGNVVAIIGVRRVHGLAVSFGIVLQRYQGKGFGEALVVRLHAVMRRLHYFVICATVNRNNIPAYRLLRSLGYHAFCRKSDYLYMVHVLLFERIKDS